LVGTILLLALGLSSLATARSAVEELIRKSGADVAVFLRTLDGADELEIGAETDFHAASTMKVPVMIELFRRAEEGELDLDETIRVENDFRSIVDGSPYALEVEDDSDADIYEAIGEQRSLRELCEAMITVSSNLATNILIDRLGAENIQRTVDALGGSGMKVLRGVEDIKAFERGLSNTTTAKGLGTLLERIAQGDAVSEKASREMVSILKRQAFNDAIPAGLPDGVEVAHKTGNITRIHHDGAIVYGPRPYVLVVLVRGIEDERESAKLIASISRTLYDAIEGVP
jgi:beta-lactamase class A